LLYPEKLLVSLTRTALILALIQKNTVGLVIEATNGTRSIELVADNTFTNLAVGILVADANCTIVEDNCFESNAYVIMVYTSFLNGEIIGNSFLDSGEDDISLEQGADITGTLIQEPSSSKSSKKGSNTCGGCPNKGKGGKTGGKMRQTASTSASASHHNRPGPNAPGRRVLTEGCN
jgi:hypothetical protein